jgi:methylated-DNA-[protein]-cysteine S-methyltransferase
MANLTIMTPVGPFTIVGKGKTVLASGFTDETESLTMLMHPDLRATLAEGAEDARDLEPAADAVRAFFAGDLTALDVVDVRQRSGGTFLETAWDALREVPAGEVVTYTDLAARSGRPAAVRAAASACARNAAALFVPCHRIVRTDGGLGGYRYGIEIKRWLRSHEQLAAKTQS